MTETETHTSTNQGELERLRKIHAEAGPVSQAICYMLVDWYGKFLMPCGEEDFLETFPLLSGEDFQSIDRFHSELCQSIEDIEGRNEADKDEGRNQFLYELIGLFSGRTPERVRECKEFSLNRTKRSKETLKDIPGITADDIAFRERSEILYEAIRSCPPRAQRFIHTQLRSPERAQKYRNSFLSAEDLEAVERFEQLLSKTGDPERFRSDLEASATGFVVETINQTGNNLNMDAVAPAWLFNRSSGGRSKTDSKSRAWPFL